MGREKNDHAMSPPRGAKITSWRDQNLAMQEGEGSYISQGFVAPQRTMVRKQTYGIKCPGKEGRVSNWGGRGTSKKSPWETVKGG